MQRIWHTHFWSWLALPLALVACAGQVEQQTLNNLRQAERRLEPARGDTHAKQSDRAADGLDGSLQGYAGYAFAHSPALRASFEKWRAASHGPAQARKLPEPVITYGAFVRSVETRVGPQQHKLSLMQWFPWPSGLDARGDAAAYDTVAAQRRFEAHVADVGAQVSRAYWKLWLIQRVRTVQQEQVTLLQTFSIQVRGHLEAGHASLADLAQVNLRLSRVQDVLAGLTEAEAAASARLVQVIGAAPGTATPMTDALQAEVPDEPGEPLESLRQAAISHPRVEALAMSARATDEKARAADAQGLPSFGIGATWIQTGGSANPGMPDDGKDPVILSLSLRLPLWAGAYSAAEQQARAEGAALRAGQAAEQDRANAELEKVLAELRDASRRISLYGTTLVPQAGITYQSVLDHYRSGRSTLAAVLLAARELLELHEGLYRAHADRGVLWAELERITGRAVAPKAPSNPETP